MDNNTAQPQTSNGTIVMMWNAQSLQGKLPELKNRIQQTNPHIIGITETWYNAATSCNTEISNYRSIRKDRNDRRGGGLQIFVKEGMPFKEITLNAYAQGKLEFIYIEIASQTNFHILLCYFPEDNLQNRE